MFAFWALCYTVGMILVTNDDGIFAPGMRVLAKALQAVDKVAIVAPDRERSAIGTAMTLRHPLRIRQAPDIMDGIEAYAVDGTPGDSVIIAISTLFAGQVNIVVSGINEGSNLGDDVLISGTVGAALQGYLHNIPSMAISTVGTDEASLQTASRLGTLIAQRIKLGELPSDILLNVNLPERLLSNISGVAITSPAHKSHVDGAEKGSDGRQPYYWLTRRNSAACAQEDTDIVAVSRGMASVTPLHTALFGRPAPNMDQVFCQNLFAELKS